METAEALFHNVFRNFGIPEEVVSDCGPQLVSELWRSFFHLSHLDTTPKLTAKPSAKSMKSVIT